MLWAAAVIEHDVDGPFHSCVSIVDDSSVDSGASRVWAEAFAAPGATSVSVDPTLTAAQLRARVASVARIAPSTLVIVSAPIVELVAGRRLECSMLAHPSPTLPDTILVAISRPDHRSHTLQLASWLAARIGAKLFGVHCVRDADEAVVPGAAVAANARVAALGAARTRIEDVSVEISRDTEASIRRVALRIGAQLVVVGKGSTRATIARNLAAHPVHATLAVARRSSVACRWSLLR